MASISAMAPTEERHRKLLPIGGGLGGGFGGGGEGLFGTRSAHSEQLKGHATSLTKLLTSHSPPSLNSTQLAPGESTKNSQPRSGGKGGGGVGGEGGGGLGGGLLQQPPKQQHKHAYKQL